MTNEPNLLVDGYNAAITHNRTVPTEAGQNITFQWETPGQTVSYNDSYITSIGGSIANGSQPAFAAFINQLNVTYAPLTVTSNNTGYTSQPGGSVFNNTDDPNINATSLVALTDTDLYVTPYNLSLLNDHIFAWGLYQSG